MGRMMRETDEGWPVFGPTFKAWREKLGLSQFAVQQRLEQMGLRMDRTQLSQVEREDSNPTEQTQKNLMKAINKAPDEFWTFDKDAPQVHAPVIQVQFGPDDPEKKYKEAVVRVGKPVPMVADPMKLLDHTVQEEDIKGYIVLDKYFLDHFRGEEDRAWRGNPDSLVMVTPCNNLCGFRMLVVDISDIEFESRKSYLVVVGDACQMVKAMEFPQGMLLKKCHANPFGEEDAPDSFMLIRHRTSKVRNLGRIVAGAVAL